MAFLRKVLLVYPGNRKAITKRIPLSVLYLAESLLQNGCKPLILDMQVDSFEVEMLKDVVCVGISTLTGEQIKYALELAHKVRQINPNIPLVWGGIHPSIMPEQTIAHPLVDYVVYGEGEETFCELVDALFYNKPITSIKGIVYRDGQRIVVNPARPFINFNKPNSLPYELLSLSKYQTNIRFEYQSSRGCPHGCLFCYNKGFNAFKWRFKDSAIVLDELEYIYKRFHPNYLFFVDDEFFISKKRALEIIEGIIKRKLEFRYKVCIRVDMFNRLEKEYLELLDKSGCFEMPMGAESGSDKILALVKKKITRSDIIRSAHLTVGSHLVPQYSFMGGFPGETIEDLHQTISCIDELWKINPDIKVNGLFFATPFPGTELYNLAIKNGYIPPASLQQWAEIDFIMSYKHMPYITAEFARELVAYAFLVRFSYLWMHSGTFLKNKRNIISLKYWGFLLFRIIFKPFQIIFDIRWKKRFIRFPLDINFVRTILTRLSV